MYQRVRFSILSPLWRQPRTVGHMLSGMVIFLYLYGYLCCCTDSASRYQNGSILIATLQPSFTILHTLTTSRGPSPIVALAWHASSSKQKSDMLATQTSDGDLRVWSVAKYPVSDLPRVIRALRRSESYTSGNNWISWSKNGRIVQYSERYVIEP